LFDWKPDETTKATFAKYGVYYADAMNASPELRLVSVRPLAIDDPAVAEAADFFGLRTAT